MAAEWLDGGWERLGTVMNFDEFIDENPGWCYTNFVV